MEKFYSGVRSATTGGPGTVIVTEADGATRILNPGPSLKVFNHSPDGFNWGYGGSGPAQLAIAILLDMGFEPWAAGALHQDFKWKAISGLEPEWSKPAREFRAIADDLLRGREK